MSLFWSLLYTVKIEATIIMQKWDRYRKTTRKMLRMQKKTKSNVHMTKPGYKLVITKESMA